MNNNEYSLDIILLTFFSLTMLIMCGTVLRKLIPALAKAHLPASVIGGLVGLAIAPSTFGSFIYPSLGIDNIITEIYAISKKLPSYLIVIVFAALMMGKPIPSMNKIFSKASTHLVVGYSIAWGQYIIGILLAMFILAPLFDANILSSALIAIGFQGGYGTAAGLGSTYQSLGFDDGYDLALGMATAGKVLSIVLGLILINIAVKMEKLSSPHEKRKEDTQSDVPQQHAESMFKKMRREKYFSADALILHFAILCIAIAIGWCLLKGLFFVEAFFLENGQDGFVQYIPLFPMALIGGIILQIILNKKHLTRHVNAHYLHSISHSFLDLLIVAAIASLSVKTIIANWQILAILISVGIVWNLCMCFLIAPWVYRSSPWTKALGDFAHSTGAATTALMIMKISDPADKTGAKTSFNFKQPLYEPIVGGGIITALSMPLIHTIGALNTLYIFTGLFITTIIIGLIILRIKKSNPILKTK